MIRCVVAIVAACTFTLTGTPSGLVLLAGLGIANLSLSVWARIAGEAADVATER